MVRESFIKFNLNRLQKFNRRIEERHFSNLQKVNELKKAYMKKALEIKNYNETVILKKDNIISNLESQIELLEQENKKLTTSLDKVPSDVIRRFNKKI